MYIYISIYIYIYIYIYLCINVCIYFSIYIFFYVYLYLETDSLETIDKIAYMTEGLIIHELFPANHHSSKENAIYGTSCLLLAFLNLTTYHLSNLKAINLI